ncbi:4Fe-4S dicluster domain-containing protein [Kosakonia oryzendophytica]|uniref:4Fe-4S dicluster domain-containing protein n=1 Tax=Kosakonia TaxID=1330547 RepID=UPI0021D9CC33|nr:4Fe-4S dicluster domain-containing protein [Kosakonia sp. ML.JS2a]UXY11111.1 4Fe-4S binding protein [Kosakonia sp. ML.JS2a]
MNRFIIADPGKCIGCRTCEVACVVSHEDNQDCSVVKPATFSARIRVVKTGTFSTAVTCHHCEDAPCANVCPVGAISRVEGAVCVEQSRCIGCKSCMIACPFGAMQVTVINNQAQALKCDLCQHRENGPACVEACPTGALSCLNPATLRENRLRGQLAGFVA